MINTYLSYLIAIYFRVRTTCSQI